MIQEYVDTMPEYDKKVFWLTEWIYEARKDGWSYEATYSTESRDRASTLKKDGWVVMILSRPPEKKTRGTISLHCWAPDGLAVDVKKGTYNFAKMVGLCSVCDFCRKTVPTTHRVAFVNRSCYDCLPKARQTMETPGWNS